jgi:FAD dependent oxidoreductase TIGR03364
MAKWDVGIVGAGIVGLAHAYEFARQGRSVVVVERDDFAVGASVRNFGMVWVVGQPIGPRRDLALRSREIWLTLLREAGIWHRECGSLHLAYAEDEMAVLSEFLVQAEDPGLGRLLTPAETVAQCPAVRREHLVGSMRSETELCVDPRTTVDRLARHLSERYGVEFRFGRDVRTVETGRLGLDGETIAAEQIVVAAGPDLRRLFPQVVAEHGLRRCRLQMLRLEAPSPALNTHLCAGLTLLHYANFASCPTLPELRARFERERPDAIAHGVHVLVSEHGDGTITVGDSHEYADTTCPYQSEEVEKVILRYLDEFLSTENAAVRERWEGFYPTHDSLPYFSHEVLPGVQTVLTFGTGMTLSFGVAERVVRGEGVPA